MAPVRWMNGTCQKKKTRENVCVRSFEDEWGGESQDKENSHVLYLKLF